jgi:hypothetical protein
VVFTIVVLILDNTPKKGYTISVPEKEPSIKWRPPLEEAAAD